MLFSAAPRDPESDMDALTPSRLMLARKRRGLSHVKLAQITGISSRSLSAYENGKQQPLKETIEVLARALDFPVGFFYAEEVDEIPVEAISFRALSKTPAYQRDAVRSVGRIAVLLNDWVDERFRLPSSDVPDLPNLDPETAAEVVRTRWGLGQAPIPNMVHLLEAHGVRVFSLAGDCTSVDACSFIRGGVPMCFLNTSKSGERIRFDAAHELAHLVLHSDHRQPHGGPELEQEANQFASAFLMPRADVLARSLHHGTVDRIIAAKGRWRVAAMALTHRLHGCNLLTEWGYRSACVDLSRAGYRSSEPNGIPKETSQLLAKVFRGLRGEGVTPAHIARAIFISSGELNLYVFGLVPTSLNGGSVTIPSAKPRLSIVPH